VWKRGCNITVKPLGMLRPVGEWHVTTPCWCAGMLQVMRHMLTWPYVHLNCVLLLRITGELLTNSNQRPHKQQRGTSMATYSLTCIWSRTTLTLNTVQYVGARADPYCATMLASLASTRKRSAYLSRKATGPRMWLLVHHGKH